MVENITSKEAFLMLKEEADSTLVDVRTEKELYSVGCPDLNGIGKSVSFIEWSQSFFLDTKQVFLDRFMEQFDVNTNRSFLFICKSGIRSDFAALTVEESINSGQNKVRIFNIVDGFEGNSTSSEFDNGKNGWKFLGLPWTSPTKVKKN